MYLCRGVYHVAEETDHRRIKKSGKRITKQRQVIFDVILDREWINCKEVYYEAVKVDPSIGLSTVYRTMRTLEEIGILKCGYRYTSQDKEIDKISQ